MNKYGEIREIMAFLQMKKKKGLKKNKKKTDMLSDGTCGLSEWERRIQVDSGIQSQKKL